MTSPHRTDRSWTTVTLSNEERANLEAFAQGANADPYDNYQGLRRHAQMAWKGMTAKTVEHVSNLAQGLSRRPELYISNLPVDPELPPTPTIPQRGRTIPGGLSEFITLTFSLALGSPISYVDQRYGNLFHDVFPTRENATNISSQSSTAPLGFHTEMFFHPGAPDFLVLHCLRPDPDHEAITSVAAIEDVINTLDRDTVSELCRPQFAIDLARLHGSYTHDSRAISESDPRPLIAVVELFDNSKRLRFEPELMTPLTHRARQALHQAARAWEVVAAPGTLDQGGFLIIDNRRAAHSRSPFRAAFEGNDRWLRRTMVRHGSAPPAGYYVESNTELSKAWDALGVELTVIPYIRESPEGAK
jgi:L-asparagine oxygenase